jgi:hypothetical protein
MFICTNQVIHQPSSILFQNRRAIYLLHLCHNQPQLWIANSNFTFQDYFKKVKIHINWIMICNVEIHKVK